jgi:hypothetical protein
MRDYYFYLVSTDKYKKINLKGTDIYTGENSNTYAGLLLNIKCHAFTPSRSCSSEFLVKRQMNDKSLLLFRNLFTCTMSVYDKEY